MMILESPRMMMSNAKLLKQNKRHQLPKKIQDNALVYVVGFVLHVRVNQFPKKIQDNALVYVVGFVLHVRVNHFPKKIQKEAMIRTAQLFPMAHQPGSQFLMKSQSKKEHYQPMMTRAHMTAAPRLVFTYYVLGFALRT